MLKFFEKHHFRSLYYFQTPKILRAGGADADAKARLVGACWRYAMVSCTLKPLCSGRLFLGCRAYASGTAKCLPYAPLVGLGGIGPSVGCSKVLVHWQLISVLQTYAMSLLFPTYLYIHRQEQGREAEGRRRAPCSVFALRSCRPSEQIRDACHHHQFSFLRSTHVYVVQ